MQTVGPSPPDWPHWSFFTGNELVSTYHPDVFGPVEQECHAEEFDWRLVAAAHVSPDGQHLAVYLGACKGGSKDNQLLMLQSRGCAWEKLWSLSLHKLDISECSAFFVREHYAVRIAALWTLTVFDVATGAELGSAQYEAAVTVPHTCQLAGHFVLGQLQTDLPKFKTQALITGYAPDGTRLWSISCPRARKIQLRVSRCGRYYDVDVGHGLHELLDVVSGACVAAFRGHNAEMVTAIDADRYLCYSRGFVILGRSVDGTLSPEIVRGPQNLSDSFDEGDLVALAAYGRGAVLVTNGDCLVAVNTASAAVVKLWQLPKHETLWTWPLAQCAGYEHTRALEALAAVDELNVDADGVGLVRAVLAGFMA